MFHHPPKFTYKGLTIILSNASRFDSQYHALLSGNAGLWFKEECLRPEINFLQCDIYDLEAYNMKGRKLLQETKCVLLMGEQALKSLVSNDLNLNPQRGCPQYLKEYPHIPAIATYLPIDAFDVQDWESTKNPLLTQQGLGGADEYGGTYSSSNQDDEDDEDEGSAKDHGKTRRSNYRFWVKKDTERAKKLVLEYNGIVPIHPTPTYHIYPSFEDAYEQLVSNKSKSFFLDIETDLEERPNLRCVGFSFGLPDIFVVPIFRFDGSLAYDLRTLLLVRALAIAMRDNETVIHNSMFDLFVLCHFYRIPFGRRIYDTMIAHHKSFVGIEKSLGHGMSHLTWLPYHKDEGIFAPHSAQQERTLWEYNGKDIYGMALLRSALDDNASNDAGLRDSIRSTNLCLYSFLLNSMVGLRVNEDKVKSKVDDNDRKMMQIMRIIKILTGGIEMLPSSNKQCCEYFHDMMGYKVVARSTKTHRPSLGKLALYKLKIALANHQQENPVLDLTIRYRQLQKQTSGLMFERWNKQ